MIWRTHICYVLCIVSRRFGSVGAGCIAATGAPPSKAWGRGHSFACLFLQRVHTSTEAQLGCERISGHATLQPASRTRAASGPKASCTGINCGLSLEIMPRLSLWNAVW